MSSDTAGVVCRNCGASDLRPLEACLLSCAQCQFLFVGEAERARQQAVFHAERPADPAKVAALARKYPLDRHPKCGLYHEVASALLARAGRPASSLCVLDVGASGGGLLRCFEHLGVPAENLDALEVNPDYIELARDRYSYRSLHGNVETFQGDRRYDLITMFDVLEHVDRFEVALRNLHGLLKAGGLLYLKLPNGRWMAWKLLLARLARRPELIPRLLYLEPGGHLNYWTPRNLRGLEAHGLRLLETSSVRPRRSQFGVQLAWRLPFYLLDRLARTDRFPEFQAVLQRAGE